MQVSLFSFTNHLSLTEAGLKWNLTYCYTGIFPFLLPTKYAAISLKLHLPPHVTFSFPPATTIYFCDSYFRLCYWSNGKFFVVFAELTGNFWRQLDNDSRDSAKKASIKLEMASFCY